ncbi:MAG: dUTP diphosphatase [Candidatus Nomurabacteria bacterium]|jgi:dUTP pyrophosphatase|nr:dUTP diphosphatase [Candidatus Nomurabacteria bacterium]
MKMKIKRVRDGAKLPQYQTAGAAGFDFHACIDEPLVLKPGKSQVIPTGLGVEIPEGYELQVRPRSGLAYKHDVVMFNSIGTIDSDFRGEMFVKLANYGEKDFVVEPEMRIAQGVVAKVETIEWQEVAELSETGRRGGFGSTGLK